MSIKKILLIGLMFGILWGLIETFLGNFLHSQGVSGISKIMGGTGIIILIACSFLNVYSPSIATIVCVITRGITLLLFQAESFNYYHCQSVLLSPCNMHIMRDILIIGSATSTLIIVAHFIIKHFRKTNQTI